ncbi:MAG: GFA family protein [Myxococcales bacterium]|nr:GFA family protein [Myxococcales bacterium]MDH3484231.1 GFA family protein [Myxococcales bacterium]
MSTSPAAETVEGGCHCGAVRFRARISSHAAIRCNCSICTKKGFLHLLVPEEDFELLQGTDAIQTYTFGTHTAKHHFCKHCGIHSFYRPRSHPDRIDVNVYCLEGIDPSAFDVTLFDGKDWKGNIADLLKR